MFAICLRIVVLFFAAILTLVRSANGANMQYLFFSTSINHITMKMLKQMFYYYIFVASSSRSPSLGDVEHVFFLLIQLSAAHRYLCAHILYGLRNLVE